MAFDKEKIYSNTDVVIFVLIAFVFGVAFGLIF